MGNGINFLLTSMLVRHYGGLLKLRIDDMDETRCKRAFVDDLFFTLEWLGITCDEGPSGTDEFYRDYSMAHKRDYYRNELQRLYDDSELLYACACSRKQIEARSINGLYPQTCRYSGHTLRTGHSAMRLHVPEQTHVSVGNRYVVLDEAMGDFILWRRDGLAAYQFVSVIEDRDMGVNYIVRGEDLFVSSAAQRYLAPLLGAQMFAEATFIHHSLITDNSGRKLSKSEGAFSLAQMRHEGAIKAKAAMSHTAQKHFEAIIKDKL